MGITTSIGVNYYKAARLEPPLFKVLGFPASEPHHFCHTHNGSSAGFISIAEQIKHNFDGVEQVLNIVIFSYNFYDSFFITSIM